MLLHGAEADYEVAYVWYYMAAALHDHPESQYRIGEMYDKGLGVAKDATEARKWYLKSARLTTDTMLFTLRMTHVYK